MKSNKAVFHSRQKNYPVQGGAVLFLSQKFLLLPALKVRLPQWIKPITKCILSFACIRQGIWRAHLHHKWKGFWITINHIKWYFRNYSPESLGNWISAIFRNMLLIRSFFEPKSLKNANYSIFYTVDLDYETHWQWLPTVSSTCWVS